MDTECNHVIGTDGMHSNRYCKKCFKNESDILNEWKLTYEEANKAYKSSPTKGQGKIAVADAQSKKLLKHLIKKANPRVSGDINICELRTMLEALP
jgi:hypothetical protein